MRKRVVLDRSASQLRGASSVGGGAPTSKGQAAPSLAPKQPLPRTYKASLTDLQVARLAAQEFDGPQSPNSGRLPAAVDRLSRRLRQWAAPRLRVARLAFGSNGAAASGTASTLAVVGGGVWTVGFLEALAQVLVELNLN